MATKRQTNIQKLSEENLEFSLNLYEKIASHNKDDNVFFSPCSITIAMQMIHIGARKETAEELKNAMKLNNFTTEEEMQYTFSQALKHIYPKWYSSPIFQIANRIYVQEKYGIVKEYGKTLKKDYKANAIAVDFTQDGDKLRKEINGWVEAKTRQKIKNLIPQRALNESFRMVVVNAIYFKRNWVKMFSHTFDGDFHRNANDAVRTTFMGQTAKFPFVNNSFLDCKIVELAYRGDRLAMYILLPNDVEGLQVLEKKLNPNILKSLISSLGKQKVMITLPKFKLEQNISLSDVLKSLGIEKLFSDTDADLTGICSKDGLYVSDIFHKAIIEVNKVSTEAAAVTHTSNAGKLDTMVVPEIFMADHPLLFFIYDKQWELILFLGRLTDPPPQ